MFFVEIRLFVDAKILHIFLCEAVLWQALTKILRDKAEYFFLHVDGVTLGERYIDPGTDEKVYEAAGFGNQLALDHLFRANAESLTKNRQHEIGRASCRERG